MYLGRRQPFLDRIERSANVKVMCARNETVKECGIGTEKKMEIL